jgi:hypothetical protein
VKQSAAPPTKPGALGRGFNDPRAIRALLWAFIVAATVFSVLPLLRHFRGHTIFDYELWYATPARKSSQTFEPNRKGFMSNIVLSPGNDRIFPATDFEFIAIGIFEEAGVISTAVLRADLRSLHFFSAGLAHETGKSINFRAAIGPKSDPGIVGLMSTILSKAKERFRLIPSSGIEDSPPSA